MNEDRRILSGCATWIGIILIVWSVFRVDTIIQFLVTVAVIVFGLLGAVWALNTYARSGVGNTLLAILYAYLAGTLLISAGSFLVTGDYDKYIPRLWNQRPPAPTAAVQSQSPSVPTLDTNVAEPTTAPAAPQEREAPAAEAPGTPLDYAKRIWERIAADTTASQPVSQQFEIWRLATGAFLGLQYAAGFYVAKRTRQRNVAKNFILYGGLSVLLMFTKVGEWVYSLFTSITGWGGIGYAIIVISVIFIGLSGLLIAMMGFNNTIGYILIGTICTYILTSFLYHNVQMLQFCVTPSIIMMLIVLYIAIYQARYRRYLKFG